MVSIDLETTSANPMVAEIVGVSISFKKNEDRIKSIVNTSNVTIKKVRINLQNY